MPGRVRFLTRASCMLCSEALPVVRRRVDRLGWSMDVVDVDDAGLAGEFGDRVPVVLVDEREVLAGRFDARDVKRALR